MSTSRHLCQHVKHASRLHQPRRCSQAFTHNAPITVVRPPPSKCSSQNLPVHSSTWRQRQQVNVSQNPNQPRFQTLTSTPHMIHPSNASFLKSWNNALHKEKRGEMRRLIRDLVERGAYSQRRVIILNTILNPILADNSSAPIPADVILFILQLTHEHHLIPSLSNKSIERCVNIAGIYLSEHRPIDAQILLYLVPEIVARLQSLPAPVGSAVLNHRPPPMVHLSCHLVRKLLLLSQERPALSLFQVLTDTRNIPAEIARGVDTSSRNFAFIVRATLSRTSLHWGWRQLTRRVLTDMVKGDLDPRARMEVVENVKSLLDSPGELDIKLSPYLLKKLHVGEQDSTFLIPDDVILKFYDHACQLNLGDVAEDFFSFSQENNVLSCHRYPVPRGHALTWLLEHLALKSRNDNLSRKLVDSVAAGNEDLPVPDRARFTAIAATNGYAISTRAIWERYSVGQDREAIVGNSATMLRVVSLFTSIAKGALSEIRRIEASNPSASTDTEGDDVDRNATKLAQLRQRVSDLDQFVAHVLLQYRQLRDPLETYDHFSLTSLGRALVITGKTADCFDVLKVLIDRKEVPDIHDINVALSGLAELDPVGAAKIIQRMVEKGLVPTAITFGTVIHQAVSKGQDGLADGLIQMAQQVGCRLSPKTIGTLVRAAVSDDTGSDSPKIRTNLERALSIVRSIPSPYVANVKIGKFCIMASLKAGEPVLAFKFWQLLAKDKAQWDDVQQKILRRLIARAIGQHRLSGYLQPDQCMVMLSQLRQERERRTIC